eukprot:CAMPEP_0197482918 /NCGR_PEP_ID=MMETSP1309-20131121/56613_1 /TAXON_ID=464262 /ORGANISM="Genus nov. species nov., Strain RCC998" /LENGTH=623 /DNA_ID=CAMNT_0043025491 /DNA_START=71 /DNA_END=1942 /DNA_ORIENTATION=+
MRMMSPTTATPPSPKAANVGDNNDAANSSLQSVDMEAEILHQDTPKSCEVTPVASFRTDKAIDDDDAGGEKEKGKEKEKKKELSWVDKLLTLWILIAVGLGIGLSQIEVVREGLKKASVGTTNIPIAIGLILMMYPPLAKVRYDRIPKVIVQVRPMLLSIVQNWIIGPLLMFSLAFAFLKDSPAYLQGVILVGCARCIAMVVVWNEFASGDSELCATLVALNYHTRGVREVHCNGGGVEEFASGDSELCATLVALNSVLTVPLYGVYAYALINKLLPALGVVTNGIVLKFVDVLQSVAIYLGIPFVLGLLSWLILRAIKGEEWYYGKFAKWISPITLAALLFTIVILFASEGYFIMQRPMEIVLCAAPMLIYFIVMFVSSFFMAYFLSCSYAQCATIAFTAASNNFELALAVAVSLFGSGSPEFLSFSALLSWLILRKIKGEEWYYGKFAKTISPITLGALIFTIMIMFAFEGHSILRHPMEILLCAAPMLIYFVVMFVSSFFMAYFLECDYAQCATIAFTAASNNFELALAVAVAVFGLGSPDAQCATIAFTAASNNFELALAVAVAVFGLGSPGAFATVIGPLVEIPVMLLLVHVSNIFGRLCFTSGPWSWKRGENPAIES